MRYLFKRVFITVALISTINLVVAGNAAPADQLDAARADSVVKLVERAKRYVQKQGAVKASCVFNDPASSFHHGALYVFAWTCGYKNPIHNSFAVAGAVDPGVKVFTNYREFPVFKKIVMALKEHPAGAWVSYPWKNFTNHKLMLKHTYVCEVKSAHLCLGSGYYTKIQKND